MKKLLVFTFLALLTGTITALQAQKVLAEDPVQQKLNLILERIDDLHKEHEMAKEYHRQLIKQHAQAKSAHAELMQKHTESKKAHGELMREHKENLPYNY